MGERLLPRCLKIRSVWPPKAAKTMSSEDLNSILELGWQSSREAWQLLAPNDDGEFTAQGASQTGRDMDQLAYDLRRIGHVKPARLAYSAAFVLNSMADGTIAFEPDIAEKTSQIVTVLAEMLLELEAAKEITTQEPVEIVEELQENWGLRFVNEETPSTPIASEEEPLEQEEPSHAVPSPPDESELIAVSEDLVEASGSLLERVIREGAFPHTAALGRIHHLATRVRDHVITESSNYRSAMVAGFSEELRPDIARPTLSVPSQEAADEDVSVPVAETTIPGQFEEVISDFAPGVLIVDRSPFIRMLLTTAIEAAGYVAMAVTNFEETAEAGLSRPWNIVICGSSELTETGHQLLAGHVAAWQACIITFDETPIDGMNCEQYQCRRSDLEGLLKLINSKLEPAKHSLLMSA